MLFNSYVFVLVFLPVTLLVFFFVGRHGNRRLAILWLIIASIFFYGWWNPVYLLLILSSVIFNYGAGIVLGSLKSRVVLGLSICSNLGLLGFFKYKNFFFESVNTVFGSEFHLYAIVLPLAISFFTFQQIAFLVDAYRSEAKQYNLLNYGLFVMFFPQLIAGPIVHHSEMMPQFENRKTFQFDHVMFSQGVTIFVLGLFKKVILADGVAAYATPVFSAAESGFSLTFFEAWGGALAYTFQLYFDFSGYSDMAVGIALMFGIRLPINFFSPYNAVNIIDFWSRWHITLSRFLKSYLYIPLGGNRRGQKRRYVNLMTTMLLGGLWHGAGWTFVAWGALHGFYLVINHGWHAVRRSIGWNGASNSWWSAALAQFVTFLAVVSAWVFFRAESFSGAWAIIRGMLGLNGAVLDARIGPYLPILQNVIDFQGRHAGSFELYGILWIVGLACISWTLPNTFQLVGYTGPADQFSPMRGAMQAAPVMRLAWRPSVAWALFVSALGLYTLFSMSNLSEFLYFQF